MSHFFLDKKTSRFNLSIHAQSKITKATWFHFTKACPKKNHEPRKLPMTLVYFTGEHFPIQYLDLQAEVHPSPSRARISFHAPLEDDQGIVIPNTPWPRLPSTASHRCSFLKSHGLRVFTTGPHRSVEGHLRT